MSLILKLSIVFFSLLQSKINCSNYPLSFNDNFENPLSQINNYHYFIEKFSSKTQQKEQELIKDTKNSSNEPKNLKENFEIKVQIYGKIIDKTSLTTFECESGAEIINNLNGFKNDIFMIELPEEENMNISQDS